MLQAEHVAPRPPAKLDRLGERSGQMLDEQERYKEALLGQFADRMGRLDHSRQQTKSSIDSLRANLGEIERLTATNIFKITSINR